MRPETRCGHSLATCHTDRCFLRGDRTGNLRLNWNEDRVEAVIKALEAAYYPASTRIALDGAERAQVGAALYDLSDHAGKAGERR